MKNMSQKEKEVLEFAKAAMCVDGSAKLVYEEVTFPAYIELTDSERGTMAVSWSDIKNIFLPEEAKNERDEL